QRRRAAHRRSTHGSDLQRWQGGWAARPRRSAGAGATWGGNGSRSATRSESRFTWVGGRRPPHVEYREWTTAVIDGRPADDFEAECLVKAERRGVLLVDVHRQFAVA